ncbi:MAG: hypothetical protein QNK37_21000 [Acidobacteriota bacterium]|nr:hypothetical protein [Acidobacteriota bacterium]
MRAVLILLLLLTCCSAPPEPPPPAPALPLLDVDMNQVKTIRMELPEGKVELTRQGSRWVLPRWKNYPAEPTFTDILVRTLANLPDGEKATAIPGDYGLTPTQRRVILENAAGVRLGELWVGYPLDNYRAAYVSGPNLGEVRRVRADIVPALARPTWGDRTVWRLPESVIEAVDIRGFGRDYKIERDGETWKPAAGQNIKLTETFDRLLPYLVWLKAGNVFYEPENDLEPKAGILLKTTHVDMVLLLGPVEGDVIHGRADRRYIIYHFPKQLRELVTGAVEDL